MKLHSSSEVAELIKTTQSTVNRIAAKHAVGTTVGNARIFSAADVAKIKKYFHGAAGNPSMTSGNDLWRRRASKPKNK